MIQSQPKRIFLLAGEPSGDLHGADLAKRLLELDPCCHLEGVCGPRMRAQGISARLKVEDFSVMGFSDVLKALPRLYRSFHLLLNYFLETQPDAIVFIDYPGFNLKMAKSLRKKGFKGKLIQYICPSVWAWKKHRIQQMNETLDLLLTIFPFEKAHFSNTSLRVAYVGNPLTDYLKDYSYQGEWKKNYQIPEKPLVAIFPGSRVSEIHKNFPLQLAAIGKMAAESPDFIYAISVANTQLNPLLEQYLSGNKHFDLNQNIFLIPASLNYELMRDSHTAIAKSGTVTLELALHTRPSIVMYKTSSLNRFIAKYIFRIKLPHFCIVNILSGKEVFPELIAKKFDSDDLYQSLKIANEDLNFRKNCLEECRHIQALLAQNAGVKASEAIMELLK